MNKIKRHFAKFRNMSPWTSCWKMTLESVSISILVAIPLTMFFAENAALHDNRDFLSDVMWVILIAPFFETLICQMMPIYIARKFKARFSTQVWVATVVFAVPHFIFGIGVGVCAGIVSGFYLAFLYAHWRGKSLWTGIWTTTISHSIRNTIGVGLLVLLKN